MASNYIKSTVCRFPVRVDGKRTFAHLTIDLFGTNGAYYFDICGGGLVLTITEEGERTWHLDPLLAQDKFEITAQSSDVIAKFPWLSLHQANMLIKAALGLLPR